MSTDARHGVPQPAFRWCCRSATVKSATVKSATVKSATVKGMLAALLVGLSGCRVHDYKSWQGYLDALDQRLDRTGDCDSLLDLPGAMLNGQPYPLVPVEVGAGGSGTYYGYLQVRDGYWHGDEEPRESGSLLKVDVVDGRSTDGLQCDWDVQEYLLKDTASLPTEGSLHIGYFAHFKNVLVPPLLAGIAGSDGLPNDYLNDGVNYPPEGWATLRLSPLADNGIATASRDDTGAWICMESAKGPPGPHPGRPEWHGLLLVHTEVWTLPDGSKWWGGTHLPDRLGGTALPLDLMLRLDNVDCAWSEDANDPSDDYWCYNWTPLCDGVDNDLDGEIDEGYNTDHDGNGVADCMDDWDHDGIPNVEDPDVHDYGCGGY